MTYIIGQKSDVAHIGHLKFWAERGLVHVEDSRDNSYESITTKVALGRVEGLNEFKPGIDGTESRSERKWVYEERTKTQDFIEEMLKIIRKAKEQGEPNDPRASRALKASRPTSVLMPTVVDATVFD